MTGQRRQHNMTEKGLGGIFTSEIPDLGFGRANRGRRRLAGEDERGPETGRRCRIRAAPARIWPEPSARSGGGGRGGRRGRGQRRAAVSDGRRGDGAGAGEGGGAVAGGRRTRGGPSAGGGDDVARRDWPERRGCGRRTCPAVGRVCPVARGREELGFGLRIWKREAYL